MPTVDISNDAMTAASSIKATNAPVGPGMAEDSQSVNESEQSCKKVPMSKK